MNFLDRIVRQALRTTIPEFVSRVEPFSISLEEYDLAISGHHFSVYSPSFSPYCHYIAKEKQLIIQSNSYLTSFVADCILAWHCDFAWRDSLMRYNLKKFFAEQILAVSDIAIGRSLLMETLLFEEPEMVAAYAKYNDSPELQGLVEAAKAIAHDILVKHELAHVLQKSLPQFSDHLMKDLPPHCEGEDWGSLDKRIRENLEADALATQGAWSLDLPFPAKKKLELIRLVHALLAAMNILAKCACRTVEMNPSQEEEDIRNNFFEPMSGASYFIAILPEYDRRGRSAVRVASAMAARDGVDASDGAPDVLTEVYRHMLDLMGGDTSSYRAKCEMLGHALYGNPKGVQFLQLRSKRFPTIATTSHPTRQ